MFVWYTSFCGGCTPQLSTPQITSLEVPPAETNSGLIWVPPTYVKSLYQPYQVGKHVYRYRYSK